MIFDGTCKSGLHRLQLHLSEHNFTDLARFGSLVGLMLHHLSPLMYLSRKKREGHLVGERPGGRRG